MIRRPPRSTLFPSRRSSDLSWSRRGPTVARTNDVRSARPERLNSDRYSPRSSLAAQEPARSLRSEEHTSELQAHVNLVCRLLLEKKKKKTNRHASAY